MLPSVRQLAAWWILAVALMATLWSRWLGRRGRGLEEFRRHYGSEGLHPLVPAEREIVEAMGGCIACGLCDRGEGVRRARSRGAYPGIMAVVLSSSRSPGDFPLLAPALETLDDSVLAEREVICPGWVPVRRLVRMVRDRAEPT